MKRDDFFKLDVYDMELYWDNDKNLNGIKPYMQALAQKLPAYDGDEYIYYRVLDVINENSDYKFIGRMPVFGDIVSVHPDCAKYYDLTENDYKRCEKFLDKYVDMRNSAPWKITGRFYDQLKSGQKYYEIEQLQEESWQVDRLDGIKSLEDAENWLLMNHPDFYMGASISHAIPSGDFIALAVPCAEYPDDEWETWEGRREYVKSLAAKRGIKLGPIEHDRDGKSINLHVGDEIEYVENPEDPSNSMAVSFVVTACAGKYPDITYSMKILSCDPGFDRSESEFPSGEERFFTTREIGHYFSDIDCNDKHMYAAGGLQKSFDYMESDREKFMEEREICVIPEDKYDEVEVRRWRERELPDIGIEDPGYDAPTPDCDF